MEMHKDLMKLFKKLEKKNRKKEIELNLSDEIFFEKLLASKNNLTQITESLSQEKTTSKDKKPITYPKILQDI